MTKSQWEDAYQIIKDCHSEFRDTYTQYKHGKNKKIRDTAKRNVYSSIERARILVEGNTEILGLLLGSKFGHQYAYGEFWEARYFGGDMAEFLSIMRQKIDAIEGFE